MLAWDRDHNTRIVIDRKQPATKVVSTQADPRYWRQLVLLCIWPPPNLASCVPRDDWSWQVTIGKTTFFLDQATWSALPIAIPGKPYSASPESSLDEGVRAWNLPSGLRWARGGIVGTPTGSAGTTMVWLANTIDGKILTKRQVPLVVQGTIPTIVTEHLAQGTVGQPYTESIFVGQFDGTDTPRMTVTGLPSGLAFDPVLWMITGTPTTPGTYSVTVSITNEAGAATRILPLIVTTRTPGPTPTAPPTD